VLITSLSSLKDFIVAEQFHCSSIANCSPHLGMTGKMAPSRLRNFCKAKGKERGARDPSPPYKAHKGAKYGIPDSGCRRINDGALRSNYRGLFKTT
jgi:hypothetical protein